MCQKTIKYNSLHVYIYMYLLYIICKNTNLKSLLLKKKLWPLEEEKKKTGTKLSSEKKVTKTINQFNCLRYINNDDDNVYSVIQRALIPT